jgi:L-lactate utilization protein LutB
VQALAAHIGSDDDTDTIVAAVRQEIRDAVVRVDVNVTGTPAT